jgi:hypothetical protein
MPADVRTTIRSLASKKASAVEEADENPCSPQPFGGPIERQELELSVSAGDGVEAAAKVA